MAYATKYLFKWESVNGTTREIRVLLDGYSGSVVQRRLGRAPVLKKQHNGNVYGTSLEFYAECAVDGEFAEFYTTDPKAYRVDLYSGNTLLWQGYITPELYAEPDIAPPYDVQVIATDGVGELKLYDFAPQGLVSLRSMLTYLLGYTGLTTDVYLISSIKPGGSGAAGSLLEKTINLDYMAGKSCYEVLSYILDTLHATITWWKGAWILARETNVKFSSGKVQYFNTSGNAGTLAGSVVTLGKLYTNDAWPVGQLSSKIDPAKNSVRIQAPWHPVTALSNPGMTSDTGWTKTGGAAYDSTNHAYHLPGASLSAIPRISQTLSLSSLKNPMTLAAKVTGVSADLSLSTLFTAAMGFYVTYEVGGTTYHLERSDEGLVWKQGAMPSLLNYTNTIFTFLKTFDEDRTGAQTVDIEIPPFLLNNAFPAGTLAVYVFGGCVRVYGASLDVIISKGYQDNLHLDNDARGEGDEVEIAIGRETSAISPYQAFLQGILLDSGSLITSFKDDYITSSGLDFMSFIARDYARSFALPRIVQTGTVSLESSVTFPPLVFTKGALDYWLEGYSWNMLDDELDISARSLPTVTITVDSETVTEAGGTASSAAQGGSSSGGGSSINPVGGTNYFQIDEDLQTLLEPKPQFDFLSPKKGLIFDSTPEADVASSPAHLMLRNLGTQSEPNYVLYTPFALITGGDQIVGPGTPGGGGGGAGYLYELGDIYHDTDKTKVLRTDGTTPAAVGDVLQLTSLTGGNKWAAVPATDIGRVYSGGTGITINGNEISVTANTYAPYYANGYVKKDGDTMTGALTTPKIRINTTGGASSVTGGVYYYNGTTDYLLIGQMVYNLWIGANETTGTHHPGSTYISTGTGGGLYASVYSNGSATNYDILHGGNYSSFALPLTGGTISATGGVSLYVNSTYASQTAINIQRNGTSKLQLGYWDSDGSVLYDYTSGHYVNIASNGVFKYDNAYTFYHSGNDGTDSGLDADLLDGRHLTQIPYLFNYGVSGIGNSTSVTVNDLANYYASTGMIYAATDNPRGAAGWVHVWSQAWSGTNAAWVSQIAVDANSATGLYYRTNSSSTIVGKAWTRVWDAANAGSTSYPWSAQYFATDQILIGKAYDGTVTNVIERAGNGQTLWLQYYNTGNIGMCIGGGNVGIGTSSPGFKLDVSGAANSWTSHISAYGGTTQVYMCYPNIGLNVRSTDNVTTTTLLNVGYNFSSSSGTMTSALYVRGGDGNVGIGTTSPTKKFHVAGQAQFMSGYFPGTTPSLGALNTGTISIIGSTSAGAATNYGAYAWVDYSSGNSCIQSGRHDSNTTTYDICLNPLGGRVNIGSTSGVSGAKLYVAGAITSTGDQVISSDINLKKNIKDLDLTVEQIAQLPAVTFDWKDGRGSTFGTVAQGVLPIFPQAVRGNEGNYSVVYGQGGWVFGVKNARAIVDLQKHETEQDKEIKQLREKVQRLEEDNLRLKARLNMN